MLADIITSFISPPGLFVIILLTLSLYALKKPRRIILASLLVLLSISIYVSSIPITTFYLNKWFIDVYKPQLPPDNEKTAIIVLAGGNSNNEDGQPIQPNSATLERLFVGVKLTKEHPSFSYIILSGGDTMQRNNVSAAKIMEYAATTMDCKAKIILEENSRNTDENLKYCAEIIKKLKVKNVVIVTNNFHIRRSIDFAYLYMPNNVVIYPYPSGEQQSQNISLSFKYFLPDMRVLRIIQLRIKEVIGLLLT